ncbi:VOC family protein [Octadecabacter ascidiaceicola]|uniref:Glyoxalase-like domain protein n=1 Tax=Octadecabacter ascidiaceicola TaxID=1655543 RepID=A0A238KN66_9RHOB|nr:VOC family protein [Octadecabacter ascidiaceicola]SMX44289.1 Glyoxalase-like domain protein [Octadecabacter ascidiaceicola]
MTELTPYFTVADGDAFIAFLETVFGGTVVKDDRYENGRIQHARVQFDDAIIMINEASDSYPANASQMHLEVADVEATYAKALAHGATSLMQPNTRPHGARMAGIKDPCGNTWWVATPLT